MQSVTIHKSADVQSERIGSGTTIWQFCVVLPGAVIGENCNINAMVLIEGDVVVGDNVTVKTGVQLWDGLRVSDNAFIGPNVTFTNDFLPRSKLRPERFLQTNIQHHASIGANATIIGGVTVGAYAMVGAGSVVTKDVPNHGLVYGNPARLQGYVCVCGAKLPEGYVCGQCGAAYQMRNDELISVEG